MRGRIITRILGEGCVSRATRSSSGLNGCLGEAGKGQTPAHRLPDARLRCQDVFTRGSNTTLVPRRKDGCYNQPQLPEEPNRMLFGVGSPLPGSNVVLYCPSGGCPKTWSGDSIDLQKNLNSHYKRCHKPQDGYVPNMMTAVYKTNKQITTYFSGSGRL